VEVDMRESGDGEASGGELIWLRDPGTDPDIAGPLAVDLTEVDELVEEALATLSQVAVVGTLYRMRQDRERLAVEVREPATGKSILVELTEAVDDDVEFTVGDRVTATGRLTWRNTELMVDRAELFRTIT
jgi:hypothetical protein